MRYHRNIRQGYDPLIVKLNARKKDEGATQGVSYRDILPILGTIPLNFEWDMLSIPCVHQGDKLFSLIGQDLTFGGGVNGSLWDKEGKLVTGLDGGPRYTFDPAEVGKYEGVYVEKTSINNVLNRSYQSTNVQISQDNLFFGSECLVVETAVGNTVQRFRFNQDGDHLDGEKSYFIVKKFNYTYFGFTISGGLGSSSRWYHLNLDNGIIEYKREDSFDEFINVIELGEKWWKVIVERTSSAVNSGLGFFYFPIENNLSIGYSEGSGIQFLGNGEKYLFGHAQRENSRVPTSVIKTEFEPVSRPADTYTLENLINPTNPYTKFFIKNENRLAESYDPQSGQKTIYENGVQIGQEAYTSTDDFVVTSQGSDKYKCFAFKQGELTQQQLIDLTAAPTS